jgi:hypothetical protein
MANVEVAPWLVRPLAFQLAIAPGVLDDAIRALRWGDTDPMAQRALETLIDALEDARNE